MEEREDQMTNQLEISYDKFRPFRLSFAERYNHGKCADVRDKISGLHSFAAACWKEALPADYTCSAYVLCSRLLQRHLDSHFWRNERHLIVAKVEILNKLYTGWAIPIDGIDE